MALLAALAAAREHYPPAPLIVDGDDQLWLADVEAADIRSLEGLGRPSVVALVGDFDAWSIRALLALLEAGHVVVPLTDDTSNQHDHFLAASHADHLLRQGRLQPLPPLPQPRPPLLERLLAEGGGGLVLFSTGTTGAPKAILHRAESLTGRFGRRRPALVSLGFLLFDHIGGLNTLLHLAFNGGTLVRTRERQVETVLALCRRHGVELLPATPTFLRMLCLHPELATAVPASLRLITYGTERMDPGTLRRLHGLLPGVQFRQTYGLSELGILPVRSRASDSVFFRIGDDDGVQVRIRDGSLQILAPRRMLGYLNAPTPFDADGWLDTGDLVEVDADGWYTIIARRSSVINVGGLKLLPAEIEAVALAFAGVLRCRARGVTNPITGEYAELLVEPEPEISLDLKALANHLAAVLPPWKRPARIRCGPVAVSHRLKQR
ncbi:MAG: fatty acid--CoA ligase family protein [Cyanobacteriota bacterium]|nr:fatty acid--CoA ligase family protein [Cyanobacteriota bacterium]